jgi:hypothetical protein
MYFVIEGSAIRLGGTMHRVPLGCPLADWAHDAISWARVIYLEHDKQESDRGQYAPPDSRSLAHRLPRSWPRIESKYRFDLVRLEHLARLRPFAVTSDVLDQVPTDEGVEPLVIARLKEPQPSGPLIKYLGTAAQTYALYDSVSDAVWDDAASWALDNPDSFKRVLETSYHAWFTGDFEEVDRISTLHTRNRFAPIKHAVITSRNHLWLPIIREIAQSARKPTLILVGAAHLGGADGLLQLLSAGELTLTCMDR